MDDKRSQANIKMISDVKKASLYRSFQINIVNSTPPFAYRFIYTPNGIDEVDPAGDTPTIKVMMSFEMLNAILTKKVSLHDAVYSGLVQVYGDQPQLHMNILLGFFGDMV
jgi:hypothetical protein